MYLAWLFEVMPRETFRFKIDFPLKISGAISCNF